MMRRIEVTEEALSRAAEYQRLNTELQGIVRRWDGVEAADAEFAHFNGINARMRALAGLMAWELVAAAGLMAGSDAGAETAAGPSRGVR